MPRYESIRIRGLGQFDDVELDLTELTGLVGVTGPNGSGKTTLLELLTGGSSYRQCPTRGSLVKLAGDRRDGLLEVRVDNGTSYTLKHLLDGVSGKSEASVTNEDGQPALETTKVRDFDAWAAKHLMPPEVLYSGAVAVQGRRGFLDMTPGDRKGMFLRAIGNEHLEAKADRARERAREARREVEVAERRSEDEQARMGNLGGQQALLGEARELAASEGIQIGLAMLHVMERQDGGCGFVDIAQKALEEARGFQAEKEAQVAELEGMLDAHRKSDVAREQLKAREAATARGLAARERSSDILTRLGNNRDLLKRKDEIEGAMAATRLIEAVLGGELSRDTNSGRSADSVSSPVTWRAEPFDEHRLRVVPVVGLDLDGGSAVLARSTLDLPTSEHDPSVGSADLLAPAVGAQITVPRPVGSGVGVEAGASPSLPGAPGLLATLATELHASSVTPAVDILNQSGLRGFVAALDRDVVVADGKLGKAKAGVAAQDRHVESAEKVVAGIEQRLGDEETVLAAVKALPTMVEAVTSLEREYLDIEARIAQVSDMLIHGKDTRILNLRTGLSDVVNSVDAKDLESAARYALTAIDCDDEAANAGEAAPGAVADGREELDRVRRLLDEGRTLLAESERLGALAAGLETARTELADAEKAEADADAMLDSARAAADEAEGDRADAQQALDAANETLRVAEVEKRSIPMKLIALAPKLAVAETRIAELETDQAAAMKDVGAAVAELDGLPEPDGAVCMDDDPDAIESQLTDAKSAASSAALAVGRADAAAETAQEGAARITELVMEERAAAERYSDWERLSQDLGRNGLQAMEIDAAIPELNAVANDLLHRAHSSRFTAEVTTRRLDSQGKRELEGLDVRVIDTEKGRDALAETYSGGELVIVGEAIALAITVIACRRSGMSDISLIRDESGAALDPENTRSYAAMLRQAMGAMGARYCLLVSHSVEMQELCDSQIRITSNGLEVR